VTPSGEEPIATGGWPVFKILLVVQPVLANQIWADVRPGVRMKD
jgi:hypothetical protein